VPDGERTVRGQDPRGEEGIDLAARHRERPDERLAVALEDGGGHLAPLEDISPDARQLLHVSQGGDGPGAGQALFLHERMRAAQAAERSLAALR
jgi:hypothetical protein